MPGLCGTFGGGEDSSHFVRALLGSLKIKCGIVDVIHLSMDKDKGRGGFHLLFTNLML